MKNEGKITIFSRVIKIILLSLQQLTALMLMCCRGVADGWQRAGCRYAGASASIAEADYAGAFYNY